MKYITIICLFFPISLFAEADHFIYADKSHDGPLETVIQNTSSDNEAMTEVRAGNDVGCFIDVGTTSSNYASDVTLGQNQPFIVVESTCGPAVVKVNNDNPLCFSIGWAPRERFCISLDGITVKNHGNTKVFVTNQDSGASVGFYADNGGYAYVGAWSNSPTQIMANGSAKVTVWPSGNVELWKSNNCPAAGAPQNGGYLCVDQSGALWYRGPLSATKIANP